MIMGGSDAMMFPLLGPTFFYHKYGRAAFCNMHYVLHMEEQQMVRMRQTQKPAGREGSQGGIPLLSPSRHQPS